MLRLLALSTLACMLFCASCTNDAEPVAMAPVADTVPAPPPPVRKGTNAITFPEDGYTQYSPITFIDYLKENVASGTVLLDKAPKDWVKKQHIPQLIAMLDNVEPCAGVSLKNEGPNPPDNVQSSIAAEALLLIESYRQKLAYPSQPGSLQFIKILSKSTTDPSKLILLPQKHQIDDAKSWAAKQ